MSHEGFVEVRVSDHGPGIPEAERAKVFEEFYRGDRTATAGTGLGLAIARSLTEAQGGTLTCEETPGGGTTMALRFPTGRTQDRSPAGAP